MRIKRLEHNLVGALSKIETDLAHEIQGVLSQPCLNLVGQSSIMQMLALIDKVDLVIALIQVLLIWLMMQTPVLSLCSS